MKGRIYDSSPAEFLTEALKVYGCITGGSMALSFWLTRDTFLGWISASFVQLIYWAFLHVLSDYPWLSLFTVSTLISAGFWVSCTVVLASGSRYPNNVLPELGAQFSLIITLVLVGITTLVYRNNVRKYEVRLYEQRIQ